MSPGTREARDNLVFLSTGPWRGRLMEGRQHRRDPQTIWDRQRILDQLPERKPQRALDLGVQSIVPHQLGEELTRAISTYLRTQFDRHARDLIQDEQLRRLRSRVNALEEEVAALTMLAAQAPAPPLPPANVALTEHLEEIMSAVKTALTQLALTPSSIELEGSVLRILFPAAMAEDVEPREFSIYRELAARLPLPVYRALTLDVDIDEEDE